MFRKPKRLKTALFEDLSTVMRIARSTPGGLVALINFRAAMKQRPAAVTRRSVPDFRTPRYERSRWAKPPAGRKRRWRWWISRWYDRLPIADGAAGRSASDRRTAAGPSGRRIGGGWTSNWRLARRRHAAQLVAFETEGIALPICRVVVRLPSTTACAERFLGGGQRPLHSGTMPANRKSGSPESWRQRLLSPVRSAEEKRKTAFKRGGTRASPPADQRRTGHADKPARWAGKRPQPPLARIWNR